MMKLSNSEIIEIVGRVKAFASGEEPELGAYLNLLEATLALRQVPDDAWGMAAMICLGYLAAKASDGQAG